MARVIDRQIKVSLASLSAWSARPDMPIATSTSSDDLRAGWWQPECRAVLASVTPPLPAGAGGATGNSSDSVRAHQMISAPQSCDAERQWNAKQIAR